MSPDRGTSVRRLYDNAVINISTEAIDRAIYLNVESKGKKPNKEQPPPAFGGTLIEGIYTPTLLDPNLGMPRTPTSGIMPPSPSLSSRFRIRRTQRAAESSSSTRRSSHH
jgi:hypothetical protein